MAIDLKKNKQTLIDAMKKSWVWAVSDKLKENLSTEQLTWLKEKILTLDKFILPPFY